MKKFATVTLVLLMAIMCIAFAACDKTPEDTTPTEYKVTIDSQNGLKTRTVSVKIGETFDLPNQPYNQGMIFLGWYTTPSGQEGKKIETSFVPESDLTIYARWESASTHVHDFKVVNHIEPTCDKEGYDEFVCYCGKTEKRNSVAALGHDFAFDSSSDDFMSFYPCKREGCTSFGRRPSERNYNDKFVVTFDEARQAKIDALYQEITDTLAEVDRYDAAAHAFVKDSALYAENKAFEEKYNAFYDELVYLVEQYQYSYVFYCVDDNEKNTELYETISEYRTDLITKFYSLYRKIYDTKFREYFFSEEDGWTADDIKEALDTSDSYGGDAYAELNKRISEIEVEFRNIANPGGDKAVLELYEEFVNLNNQIAVIAGYDNYIDYAYKNVYSRDYTPEDVAKTRQFLKEYVKPVYLSVLNDYRNSPKDSLNGDAKSLYYSLSGASFFSSKTVGDYVADYFRTMNSKTAGKTEIDFYKHANELMKNGNYYTGNYQGAFSYWIGAQNTSILYFGPGSYSGAFTFVHEFGHYYNTIYNHGASMSYDLEETHSQGNEMLFLSYLRTALPENVATDIFQSLYANQMFDAYAIVMLAACVDEFEYCVYTGTDPDGNPATYTANDYDALFEKLMSEYGIATSLNPSYWRYVVIESPCYYISYSMSMLPCLELYMVSETEGHEAAMNKYFKLFTFTDDEANVKVDSVGDTVVEIGYSDTLVYAGLTSPFDESLYQRLKEFYTK